MTGANTAGGPTIRSNAVLLHHISRTSGQDWAGGTSWLGGLPVLGGADWPRNPMDGDALHFVAQVSLADLPDLDIDIPRTGTLGFFVESDLSSKMGQLPYPQIVGRVIWSDDTQGAVTKAPADCGPIHREDWSFYWKTARNEANAPRVFPRWPVQPVAFACPPDGLYEIPDEAFGTETASPPRQVARTSSGGRALMPAREAITWRVVEAILDDTARALGLFDASVRLAEERPSKWTEALPAWQPLAENVRAFVAKWDQRRDGHMPDTGVGTAVVEELTADMAALANEMRSLKGHYLRPNFLTEHFVRADGSPGTDRYWHFHEAISRAYDEMRVAEDAVYRNIPDVLRTHLEQPTSQQININRHQMFGAGATVQDVAAMMGGMVMLCQFSSDPYIGMMWGDVGFVKFWIAPADLADGAWDKVVVTFEG
ncbi:DUF1963 domain-containing protein [Flavimaricola marinus]|uniref:DUF1963 domain-containing protein n=1 Tax=Flavimaricola marinus TaxID=1819565 RepID=A0A238LJM7_9RHOB|nr:DUF1963 domain-containing protein [Flavimaricola marinus]SMY09595.1 hypothetical protein LOM8899_03764 [Flavimaricola marinus]